jgi:hypothetical protein
LENGWYGAARRQMTTVNRKQPEVAPIGAQAGFVEPMLCLAMERLPKVRPAVRAKARRIPNAAPQIDHAIIERALSAAVERERAAWRRKLEEGRARVRQILAAATSAGQSFDKLKVLLEETERIGRRFA